MDSELHYPEAIYLPVLYIVDKRGKERLWKTWTIGNIVYRCYGLVDGEKQVRKRSYSGVNIGRKNETTAEQQAELSMRRMWTKQLDKTYTPKCKEGKKLFDEVCREKNLHGGNNRLASMKIGSKSQSTINKTLASSTVDLNVIPMKAGPWTDKNTGKVPDRVLKHFNFEKGVYLQWKLDGFRCIARIQNDQVVLTTNSGKQYPWLSNLRKEIQVFLKDYRVDGLDGELYSHRIEDGTGKYLNERARFSAIQSICTQDRIKPHPQEDQICLYVFDLVDISGEKDQTKRLNTLNRLFKRAGNKTPHIKQVETRQVFSSKKVFKWHYKFSQKGFEGIIIRDASLIYRPKHRSLKMRKYKGFIDDEFIVIDTYLDSGVQKEYFVWVCETKDGKRFKATPMGTREEKIQMYYNRIKYIGKRLTVKFQGYSSDGVPRFPIGKTFRDSGDI